MTASLEENIEATPPADRNDNAALSEGDAAAVEMLIAYINFQVRLFPRMPVEEVINRLPSVVVAPELTEQQFAAVQRYYAALPRP